MPDGVSPLGFTVMVMEPRRAAAPARIFSTGRSSSEAAQGDRVEVGEDGEDIEEDEDIILSPCAVRVLCFLILNDSFGTRCGH